MSSTVILKARWLRPAFGESGRLLRVNKAIHLWLIVLDMHLSAGCGPDVAGCGLDVAGCGSDADQHKVFFKFQKN